MDSFIIQKPKSPDKSSIPAEASQVSELSDDPGLKIEILEPKPKSTGENDDSGLTIEILEPKASVDEEPELKVEILQPKIQRPIDDFIQYDVVEKVTEKSQNYKDAAYFIDFEATEKGPAEKDSSDSNIDCVVEIAEKQQAVSLLEESNSANSECLFDDETFDTEKSPVFVEPTIDMLSTKNVAQNEVLQSTFTSSQQPIFEPNLTTGAF